MSSAVNEVLTGLEGSYLLPFFWLHGASEDILRHGIGKIYDANIRQICVESRPHPDFCGPGWWRDLDVIMDEAQRRNMRVWVLDDKKFPSGFAGGLIADKYPQHRRRFLSYVAIDALGPDPHASFLVNSLCKNRETDRIVAVVAAKRRDAGADWQVASVDVCGGMIDLTGQVRNGRVYWPVPEGLYSVFVVYSYLDQGIPLLNPISRQAVACQIEGCYQPHYERYAHLFGNTFAGFFSDEPQFANGGWNSVIGTDMPLPWSDELESALSARQGAAWRALLPFLWVNGDARTKEMRYAYMDEVTRLYSECFCGQLSDWCHARGILYIGHQVEDNNSHSRLGSGTGHFFRAQCGQDMAGVDIVMHQIHPGYGQISRHWHSAHSLTDGEFFHYGLIKLASSAAHIDPNKKGRALCENYGAYGWMEGIRLMKWLTDHCLVRGINYFTPHAFTDSAFPEWDSPPHFYAQGHNPQYRFMGRFFGYANRMCHLLSGGRHVADVLVLYQADAEWWGDAMLSQKPMRELMRRQIDFDVVPCDAFLASHCCVDGHLSLGDEHYRALVIPAAQALPDYFLKRLDEIHRAGVPIFFVDRKPMWEAEGVAVDHVPGEMVALDGLADALKGAGLVHIDVSPYVPNLRLYHYINGDEQYFLFFNEEKCDAVSFSAELPVDGPYCRFDVMNNRLERQRASGRRVDIRLEAYESVLLVAGSEADCASPRRARREPQPINTLWRISIADALQYPDFELYAEAAALGDINAPDRLPAFSGTIRYEANFTAERVGLTLIRLPAVYELAELWLNGGYAGACVSTPYEFDVSPFIRQGSNDLVIEVTNTLAKQVADYSSAIVPQEPGGLLCAPELIMLEDADSG